MQDTEDKLHVIDPRKILATVGEAGDRVQFTDYIARNLVLNATRQGRENTATSAGVPLNAVCSITTVQCNLLYWS